MGHGAIFLLILVPQRFIDKPLAYSNIISI